jgi:hypothetical protein
MPHVAEDLDHLTRFRKQIATSDLDIWLTVTPAGANRLDMNDVSLLVEAYLTAERNLVAAVESAGGALPLPDGRAITVGRAEFDALLGQRRKRAWVIIRKQAPMPARR